MKGLEMNRPINQSESGFSLVEVTLALGIVTMAILSTLGLLTVGLQLNRDSVARTEAASVAREVVTDLQMLTDWDSPSPRLGITPNSAGTTPSTFYVTPDGSLLSAASASDQQKTTAAYRVDVAFASASGSPRAVHVVLSWPPNSPESGLWPGPASSIYEAVTSLNPR